MRCFDVVFGAPRSFLGDGIDDGRVQRSSHSRSRRSLLLLGLLDRTGGSDSGLFIDDHFTATGTEFPEKAEFFQFLNAFQSNGGWFSHGFELVVAFIENTLLHDPLTEFLSLITFLMSRTGVMEFLDIECQESIPVFPRLFFTGVLIMLPNESELIQIGNLFGCQAILGITKSIDQSTELILRRWIQISTRNQQVSVQLHVTLEHFLLGCPGENDAATHGND